MKRYVGLDIGGTKFLVASADEEGNLLARRREPAPQSLEAGIDRLNEMVFAVADGEPVAAIGAAIGGPLDWETGVVSPLHQPEWNDVPLRQIMEDKWGCPFAVDVDTNIAAMGEYQFGGTHASRLLYLTLSTGMGGGFLVDGEIYRGAGGVHPEVAHQSVNYRCERCAHPENIVCECGSPDCLEALVSGNAIHRIYGKPAEELSQREWEEVGYNLGQGMRNLAAIYCPDVIVLGGGVAIGRGQRLVTSVKRIMDSHLGILPVPRVRLSELGYDTALMGAVARGMQAT